MSRNPGDAQSGSRFSALWGTGNRGGEHRSSALWGTGNRGGEHRSRRNGRKHLTTTIAVVALVLPMGAIAGEEKGKGYVSPGASRAAANNPGGKVQVIIQSSRSVADVRAAVGGAAGSVLDELGIINGVVAEIPAAAIEGLRNAPGLIVTEDAPVKASAYTSTQLWPHQNGVSKLWGTDMNPAPKAPAIAVVDTGIDGSLPDFGGRVVHRVVLTRLAQDPAKLDGRGHGSMVASMAAGEAPGYAGASPTSNLIDLDVMNDSGMAFTSDVIRAADWILANKDAYGIRVANFSLHSTALASIRVHPLNRAVQKLWLAGVVVVTAATNTPMVDSCPGDAAKALGTPRVPFSPANDPFVITVGALDINGTALIGDDSMAPWSAHGYTCEGWAKPEIAAAGRYMVGAVPANASLVAEQPSKLVAPGYMQLSGTSFSAAVVSGIVAQLLARHPDWTPDQVKGALMKTARRVVNASQLAQGRGQVNSVRGFTVQTVPNPNSALNAFVGPDTVEGSSGNAFNAASWYDAMKLSAAWDSAAWAEAGWADAAWNEAAWFDAAWNDAAWAEAAWADAAWADSDTSDTYEDFALSDPTSTDILLDPLDELDLAADPDLALP